MNAEGPTGRIVPAIMAALIMEVLAMAVLIMDVLATTGLADRTVR